MGGKDYDKFFNRGLIHLYRSLLRFCHGMSSAEAAELTYLLNTANIDSLRFTFPDIMLSEASPFEFTRRMADNKRPYRTEVQFYKSMEALNKNIIYEAITGEQREALLKMRCMNITPIWSMRPPKMVQCHAKNGPALRRRGPPVIHCINMQA